MLIPGLIQQVHRAQPNGPLVQILSARLWSVRKWTPLNPYCHSNDWRQCLRMLPTVHCVRWSYCHRGLDKILAYRGKFEVELLMNRKLKMLALWNHRVGSLVSHHEAKYYHYKGHSQAFLDGEKRSWWLNWIAGQLWMESKIVPVMLRNRANAYDTIRTGGWEDM